MEWGFILSFGCESVNDLCTNLFPIITATLFKDEDKNYNNHMFLNN
jgi:hypothetical protein